MDKTKSSKGDSIRFGQQSESFKMNCLFHLVTSADLLSQSKPDKEVYPNVKS